MKLAEKLVYLRKENRLSQLKLAEMMDVSRQAISRWETGATVPATENLKYLSKLYEVSLDYLVNDDADEPERTKEITEEPRENQDSVPIPKTENGGKKGLKWIVIALGLLGLIVAAYVYIYLSVGGGGDVVSMNNVPKKVSEAKTGPEFDLEW